MARVAFDGWAIPESSCADDVKCLVTRSGDAFLREFGYSEVDVTLNIGPVAAKGLGGLEEQAKQARRPTACLAVLRGHRIWVEDARLALLQARCSHGRAAAYHTDSVVARARCGIELCCKHRGVSE